MITIRTILDSESRVNTVIILLALSLTVAYTATNINGINLNTPLRGLKRHEAGEFRTVDAAFNCVCHVLDWQGMTGVRYVSLK
jgi:hypothetical protein